MKLLRSFKKPVIVILVLSSFAFGVSSAFAYSKWMAGGFNPYPTTVRPLSTFGAASKTAMVNAAAQWNSILSGGLVSMGSDTSNTTYPNDNNINEVTKGVRGSSGYLMETNATTWALEWNGIWWWGVLYEADIDVNLSYQWATDGQSAYYDIGNSFTHELGHLLGLDHSTVTGASMVSGSSPGTIYKRDIAQDDIDGIIDIY